MNVLGAPRLATILREKGIVIPVIQMKSSKFIVVNTIIILITIIITDILNFMEA